MTKLSDTQLIVLSKAAQRDDGAAVLPENLNKSAAAKVGASLIARKLMREIRAKPGMPVWRTSDDDRQLSLVILKAGRDAIGVDGETNKDSTAATIADAPSKLRRTKNRAAEASASNVGHPKQSIASSPVCKSKRALVIEMLSSKDGATIGALIAATGWLPHTTRAALTGLRKRGFTIELIRQEGQASIYRIVPVRDGSSISELIAA